MHTKLTIPERLKDLRVSEKEMSLQELSDATDIPCSTLGNYEKDENIDMSLINLLTLADFYHVSTDYLLCRTELRQHKNKSVSDLHLNDDAIQILTSEKYNPRLLSELLAHESFSKFMTDLEIYIDGFNDKGIQIANAFPDVMRCKLNELCADSDDSFAKVFDSSHIETEQYYLNILSEDLKPIVSDLRNALRRIVILQVTLTIRSWSKVSLMTLHLRHRLQQTPIQNLQVRRILMDFSFFSAKIWK